MKLNFSRPLMMGILNLTPDSFSDGGEFLDPNAAQKQLSQLISDGADIIDIGAESTFGPEAQISAEQEWKRLQPVLQHIDYAKIFVSLDTYKAEVAEHALKLGVQMINDVTALRGDSEMTKILLEHQPYVCLMYSADDTPYASRKSHHYQDVIATIADFLGRQTDLLIQQGFPKENIIIDPGLGFFLSSDAKVSWEVIERLDELKKLGFPILVGPSMKSFLGGDVQDRKQRSWDAAQQCLSHGANIVRMHHLGNPNSARYFPA